MSLTSILSSLSKAKEFIAAVRRGIDLGRTLLDAGKDAKPIFDTIGTALDKGDAITDADVQVMRDKIKELEDELHAPMPAPPEQSGGST